MFKQNYKFQKKWVEIKLNNNNLAIIYPQKWNKKVKNISKCQCIRATFNPIEGGPFRDWSRMRKQKGLLFKYYYTYPVVIELGTVIRYLKKIQKTYKSRNTHHELCWHQSFCHKSTIVILRNNGIDWYIISNFKTFKFTFFFSFFVFLFETLKVALINMYAYFTKIGLF